MADWLAFGLLALKKVFFFFFLDGFARRGNRLTVVFMGCNKVILMPNSFVLCIEYKLDFLAEV